MTIDRWIIYDDEGGVIDPGCGSGIVKSEHGSWVDYDDVTNFRTELMEDIATLLDAFDDGIFIRNTDRDHEPTWAMRLIKPLAAIGRLANARDAATEDEG